MDQHFETFPEVYDERFQAKYGFWRPVGRALRDGLSQVRRSARGLRPRALPGLPSMRATIDLNGAGSSNANSSTVSSVESIRQPPIAGIRQIPAGRSTLRSPTVRISPVGPPSPGPGDRDGE
jgi:hypothetical protein